MRRALAILGAAILIGGVHLSFAHRVERRSGQNQSELLRKSPPAQPARTLRLAMPDAAPTVDPALVADEENVQLANLLYAGLVKLDASFHVVPDAAQRYTISPDHRTYTFYLRPGLEFSNGHALTATDFAFSIERSLSPAIKSPSAPTYLMDVEGAYGYLTGKSKTIKGIKVLGPLTLRIKTRWATPYFLMELTYPTSFALDSKTLVKRGSEDSTSWYANPISSGPYWLKSWNPNVSMTLTRNVHFGNRRPATDRILISLAPLPTSSVYKYVHHSVDAIALPYSHSLVSRTGINKVSMLAVDGVYMNQKFRPLDRRDVRQALTLALDRPHLVATTLKDAARPFSGFVPPGEPGYVQPAPPPYDPSRARAELRSAGYSDTKRFPSLTLYYADDPSQPALAKLARAIAKSWLKNLHLSVGTQGLTPNTLLARVQSNKLPLYLAGWSADYPDPHDWLSLQWQTGALNNNVHYSNGAFDMLTRKADATWAYGRRMSYYAAAQRILTNDAAWIPLYIPYRLLYIRPEVVNLKATGYGIIPAGGSWARVQVTSATPGDPTGNPRHRVRYNQALN